MDIIRYVTKHYLLHLIPVCCIAGPLAYFRQEMSILLLAGVFAVLIDSDHLVDYLLYPLRRGFNLREAIGCAYFLRAPKIYLPLHAYDLHTAVASLFLWQGHTELALAWAAGFIVHIATDEILGHSRGNDRLRNLLTYRVANGFDRRLYDESA